WLFSPAISFLPSLQRCEGILSGPRSQSLTSSWLGPSWAGSFVWLGPVATSIAKKLDKTHKQSLTGDRHGRQFFHCASLSATPELWRNARCPAQQRNGLGIDCQIGWTHFHASQRRALWALRSSALRRRHLLTRSSQSFPFRTLASHRSLRASLKYHR